MAYGKYIRERTNSLPDNHPHKPILINNKWENDDIRDILKVRMKTFLPARFVYVLKFNNEIAILYLFHFNLQSSFTELERQNLQNYVELADMICP